MGSTIEFFFEKKKKWGDMSLYGIHRTNMGNFSLLLKVKQVLRYAIFLIMFVSFPPTSTLSDILLGFQGY